jgi:hypothetical protein
MAQVVERLPRRRKERKKEKEKSLNTVFFILHEYSIDSCFLYVK